ncbi:late embryogenesis abundant protein At1g64065 [Rhodamnia argentea]|uniref:Late embryogenesis abundant protein At1g64065 n=1 Tax=Rhodamnia argentea TaxID=178133 RepID=A0A8B8QP02_9MYRT|nr:late embryogenesis abundant protein At1g64065 [Rhodamnia argentea]
MVERDQVWPLAPSGSLRSDQDEASVFAKNVRKQRFIKCCGCIIAFMLILAVVIIILAFTVFRVKEPVIKMNEVTVTRLELVNGTVPKPGVNMSLIADVSVKNPNAASFKYSNTTTTLYYHGTVVGEARGPPGKSRAWRTMRMNISVDIITDSLLSNPNLKTDTKLGLLPMSSYSRIPGRVNMLNIVKKHVIVKMNCTMTVNISSRAIQEQKCKRHVKL